MTAHDLYAEINRSLMRLKFMADAGDTDASELLNVLCAAMSHTYIDRLKDSINKRKTFRLRGKVNPVECMLATCDRIIEILRTTNPKVLIPIARHRSNWPCYLSLSSESEAYYREHIAGLELGKKLPYKVTRKTIPGKLSLHATTAIQLVLQSSDNKKLPPFSRKSWPIWKPVFEKWYEEHPIPETSADPTIKALKARAIQHHDCGLRFHSVTKAAFLRKVFKLLPTPIPPR